MSSLDFLIYPSQIKMWDIAFTHLISWSTSLYLVSFLNAEVAFISLFWNFSNSSPVFHSFRCITFAGLPPLLKQFFRNLYSLSSKVHPRLSNFDDLEKLLETNFADLLIPSLKLLVTPDSLEGPLFMIASCLAFFSNAFSSSAKPNACTGFFPVANRSLYFSDNPSLTSVAWQYLTIACSRHNAGRPQGRLHHHRWRHFGRFAW